MILFDGHKGLPYSDGKVDMKLVHPPIDVDKHTDRYLQKEKTEVYFHRELTMPREVISKSELVLIYNQKTDEDYTNEVPVDIIELNDMETTLHAFFPLKGNYRIIFQNKNEVVHVKKITI